MVRARRFPITQFSLVVAGALALGGCQMTQGASSAAGGVAAAPVVAGPGQRVIERDVEAPEVFQAQEPGLWDGRPSLGGVWVAHPDVDDPERALIRNVATGQEVIGALFRRERENPGPRFQISSEAANALGILPGAPTEISVTALRLQRVELEIDPEPQPITAAEETLPIAPVAAPDDARAAQAGQVEAGLAEAGPAEAGQVEIVEEERPRRGLFGLFRRARAEPESASAPEIAQTALEPVADAAQSAGQGAAGAAATAADSAAEGAAPRRRGGLFGLFRRREPEPAPDTSLIALPDAPAAAAPESAPAEPAQPQGPRIDRPFVQIGIFSVEQNAINARAMMQRAGLNAEIRRGRVGENLFWRVVVGPAGTLAERRDILRRVREMGFADAYAVVR